MSNGVINHFLKHCFVGIGQLKATPPTLFAINFKDNTISSKIIPTAWDLMVESLLGGALSNRRVVSSSTSHGWVMSIKEAINLHRRGND